MEESGWDKCFGLFFPSVSRGEEEATLCCQTALAPRDGR